MGTGYHHVCGMVSLNGDRLVEMVMASDVVTFDRVSKKKKGGFASSAGPSWQ